LLGIFQALQKKLPHQLAKCYKIQGRDADAAIYAAVSRLHRPWFPSSVRTFADVIKRSPSLEFPIYIFDRKWFKV